MFKNIAIVTKLDDAEISDSCNNTISDIVEFGKVNNIPVCLYNHENVLYGKSDVLFISLGGDGTMLYTAKESLKFTNSLVLGINFGHLGFLVENFPSSDGYLTTFLYSILTEDRSNFLIDERIVLKVHRGDNTYIAMNEFLLTTGGLSAPLFYYDIHINNCLIGEQNGSGVLVNSPTGSTAMALSAGGSIMTPTSNTMQIVPIIPHSLTSRPIIVGGSDIITITAPISNRVKEFSTVVDGQVVETLKNPLSDDHTYDIMVKTNETPVRIIHEYSWNFFNVLSEKMGWK